MKPETEKMILAHVKKTAPKLGLYALRISMRPGVEAGWPDNFIFGPNRFLLGLETKSPGKPPTPLQQERGRLMVAMGFAWAKCDSRLEVEHTLYNFAAYSCGHKMLTLEEFKTIKPLQEH